MESKPGQDQILHKSKSMCLSCTENNLKNCMCGCVAQIHNFVKKESYNFLMILKLYDDECYPIAEKIIKILDKGVFYFENGPFKHLNSYADPIQNAQEQNPQSQKQEPIKPEQILDKQFIKEKVKMFDASLSSIIDLVICVGGDGTILYALHYFQGQTVPALLSFEKGTLGFMAMYSPKNVEQDMSIIKQSIYESQILHVENKMRIYGEVRDIKDPTKKLMQYHALNEIVVDRGTGAGCIRIDLFCNDVFLTELMGDGIIISTPTGSTAYHLSAGGPIIHNQCKVMSIVPICPFSLSFRPVCLPTCSVIKVKMSKDSRSDAFVTCDGQERKKFTNNEELIIKVSEVDVPIVNESQDNNLYVHWVDKLIKLLNWNNTDMIKKKKNQ